MYSCIYIKLICGKCGAENKLVHYCPPALVTYKCWKCKKVNKIKQGG
jgi:DNA-directed RNA polymerase subunit RPC12/RpoP